MEKMINGARRQKPCLSRRHCFSLFLLVSGIVVLLIGWGTVPSEAKKMKIGWVERVRVFPGNLLMMAKIDTGADNSSIHATSIESFKKNDEQWVRFTVTPIQGDPKVIERPIFRLTQITRHGAPDEDRLVVKMGICLGPVYKEDMEVNLADRSNFEYKMLIGRSFLRGEAMVDPSKEFTQEPQCFPE